MTHFHTAHGPLWVHGFGDGQARIVALHGFTLTGASFGSLAALTGCRVLAPDLPGHGRSEIEPVTMAAASAAVSALLESLERPPLLLGYSQGGRIALRAALDRPELVDSLVLVSSSPGLAEPDRELRRVEDEALATQIEELGTERFVDKWLANPITSTDRVPEAHRVFDRLIRLENEATGLAAALRGLGQASVENMRDRLATLAMPMRFIAGGRDTKYVALAREMAALSDGQAVIVPAAGHNVILERPDSVASEVLALVDRQSG